ncbi:hypothetical protein HRW23_00140 [Streptomyces lunaelactis]|nr:hypothetical protein [Streptomyces lunaelactis]NUK60979.1 hypothetical protein [Streptomyces lunaelactis]NUK73456.1 hypothetical protein [Streptomyces lunaelactis]NUK75828.1 hypothetical protein [Streptomyces lunaelactis]NUL14089.1 hypothetical protein [Streptomyces lunaelactis]
MMGEKEKDLTPAQQQAQQQAQDAAQIQSGFVATDALESFAIVMGHIGFGGGSGPGGYFGTTDFEKKQLNEMLDLIEGSNPADLEAAGEDLTKAKDALNKAAKDLDAYVKSSERDWKGEAATEFSRFGKALAAHAWELATFANAAGTQMTVASTGLTSVRNSMPRERDTRLVAKKPEAFALAPAKETNPEYIEAVKVEENRQEAINQMNRLASFYAVSESSLAGQEAPKFPGMLNADVPPPMAVEYRKEGESGATATGAESSSVPAERSLLAKADSSGTDGASKVDSLGTVMPVPDRNTSMEIDTVATPPAPTTSPGAPPPPSATGPVGPANGQVPPMASGFQNPVRGGVPRASGTSSAPRAGGTGQSAVGRPGATGNGPAASGRAGAAGRPGPMGTGPAAGRANAGGAAGRTPVVGRPGAAAQPMAGRAGTGGAAGPRAGTGGAAGPRAGRAGRADGIVGGTPQRASTGSAGSRIPRGTVIGGEGAAPGRAAARPSQSGVVGANPANSAPRSTGRGTPSSNGVVGTPRNGAPGSRPGAGGFTAGGAGFVGGRPGQRQSGDEEQERTGSARPDYLTEDEETWAARRRGAVPPVID